jgi:predicted nucleotide-binding protein
MEEQDIRREILDQISRNGKGIVDPNKLAHKLGVSAARVHDALSLLQDQRLIGSVTPTDPERVNPRHNHAGQCIFIGHGHSAVWRELKDFISETLHLQWDEFDREAFAGTTVIDRLKQMLKRATFAFLIMTAEDEHSDGKKHARENVIHEIGLFQGKLGFGKAIVLLEEGCQEFSNVHGLLLIRFPPGNIMSKSEQIRKVLEANRILAPINNLGQARSSTDRE